MNISFVKLGHEECWVCESFDLHTKVSSHKKDTLDGTCNECLKFGSHQVKYIAARKEYQTDSCIKKDIEGDSLIVSADLQKVICH